MEETYLDAKMQMEGLEFQNLSMTAFHIIYNRNSIKQDFPNLVEDAEQYLHRALTVYRKPLEK